MYYFFIIDKIFSRPGFGPRAVVWSSLLCMLVKLARTVYHKLYLEKRVYIRLTSYSYLRVLRK